MIKRFSIIAALALAAIPAFAADAKQTVIDAAKKLADAQNYTWRQTVAVPEGTQFRPGPTTGKTEKGGPTYLLQSFNDNESESVIQGEKGAMTNQDGNWESLSEVENSEGFGRFRAAMLRNLSLPAKQIQELAEGAKELKQEGDVISGDLTEEAAKKFVSTFRRRGGGGDGPEVSGASGSVKFWVKDGAIAKYEYKSKGKVSFNGNDRDIDRTTTVEIQNVGSTKVNIPEAAKKKLT